MVCGWCSRVRVVRSRTSRAIWAFKQKALRKRVRCAEVDAGNVANTEGSHEFEPREPVRFVGASIR